MAEPLEDAFPITIALLRRSGSWAVCLDQFLEVRSLHSPFYRDIAPTFLAWLASSAWGQERWPFLLELAHCEIIDTLVAHHAKTPGADGLHRKPQLTDRLVLDPATQVLTYGYRVHLATLSEAEPDPGPVHLLVYRHRQGHVAWKELTAATAALLVQGQGASIQEVAQALGLPQSGEALGLLNTFRTQGAILGFRTDTGALE